MTEDEVRRLYAGAHVTQIDEGMLENQRLRDAGAVDRCYRIEL